ncbi:permease prefix domain 2-containing transporter [Bradyrhizobium sp. USDA 223]|uniref:permease prefix domain 2-containing transporter n=1 Tax=Bradyrhizobium sp. USDA 223 TaxID=3156306 RepID=UPI0038332810
MTDNNGDDEKQDISTRDVWITYYDEKVLKVALGNLFIQKQIESARIERKKLRVMIEAAQEHLDKVSQESATQRPKRSSPPASAAILLAFVAPKHSAQALLGDLEEMFQKNVDKFGDRAARRMYWFEAARSVGPLVWQWIKRMGFITLVVDYVRSKFGL